jgi:hypothetical protein
MVILRRFWLIALLMLPAMATLAQSGSLTASVDRTTIRENESFRYILRAEGPLTGRPDLSALAVDFDVLDNYQSSSIQIVNGRTAQVAEWVVELIPRKPGRYELPPVELGGVLSNAVTVEILPADATTDEDGDVFIEVALDRETSYVQAQAIFTLRLFVGIGTGRQTLTAPLIEGGEAIVEKLGADREYQTVRGGRVYNVRERNYAIFPQEPGTLTIGPAVYEAMIMPSRGFARQQRLRSDVLELEVRPAVPPPAEYPRAVWLPATRLEITESWSGGDLFEQGVPQTRTLDIVAEGLLETQLPELSLESTAGLRQYPDQPELSRSVTANGIEAHRTERFAVIAQAAGPLELPSVELPWFDIDDESWQVARVDSRSVEVLPGVSIPPADEPVRDSAPPPGMSETDPGWWPWLSAALGIGWLATAVAWAYVARRGARRLPLKPRVPRPQTNRSLLRQLGAACRVNDTQRSRDLLLDWARRQFSSEPPQSLGALAARLSGPLAEEIRALEAVLYGPQADEWRGARLAELLKETQSVGRAAPGDDQDPLVPLYR